MAQIDTLTNVGAVVSTDLALILRGGANVLGTFGSLVGQNATAVTITGGTINGTVIGGTTAAAGSFTTGAFSGEIAANGGIALGDNDKATFGAGDDLQIFHDGASSTTYFIEGNATGNMEFRASGLRLKEGDGGNYYFLGVAGGSSSIYHNGSEKLATTATGIDVTGTATMDGLTVAASTADYVSSITNSNGTDAGGGLYVNTRWNTAANSVAKFVSNSGSNTVANFAGNGDISFYEDTGTTPKFFWDASAESLGIGTSSPFSVNGTNLEVSDALYSRLILDSTAGTRYSIQSLNDSSLGIYDLDADSERLRIDSSGNLLVGTTDPNVHVGTASGAVITSAGFGFFAVSGNAPIYANRLTSDGAIIDLRRDGTSVGSIGTRAGYVKIGTGDVGLLFNSLGDAILPENTDGGVGRDAAIDLGVSGARFKDLYLSGDVVLGASYGYIFGNTDGVNIRASSGKSTIFDTAGSERMRIDSSGNLLVGVSSPVGAGSQGVQLSGNGSVLTAKSSVDFRTHINFINPNGIVGTISTDGSTTAYNTSSDQRLKENIADADDAGSKIDAIQVRQYDWKADGSHQDYGMIAQELQLVAPEAVSGDANSEEMMGVDYSKLVPMMLKEIQSLRARLAILEGA